MYIHSIYFHIYIHVCAYIYWCAEHCRRPKMVHWNIAIIWNIGILEYWENGILVTWEPGHLGAGNLRSWGSGCLKPVSLEACHFCSNHQNLFYAFRLVSLLPPHPLTQGSIYIYIYICIYIYVYIHIFINIIHYICIYIYICCNNMEYWNIWILGKLNIGHLGAWSQVYWYIGILVYWNGILVYWYIGIL